MNLLYNLSNIPIIAKFALFLSYPFSYGLVLILFLGIIFVSNRRMYNFSLFFLSIISSWLFAVLLKNILKIKRPFVELGHTPLFFEKGFSFPSEHSAVFMAIAVSMFLINKKLGFLFLFFAILIGLSRVVIGVHYPVDILGGFLVGFIMASIFNEIFKKI